MNTPFTCITCRVAFHDLEIQRQHYKSDWHRYNLKRKVAELPSVTAEEFQKRVIKQAAASGANDDQEEKSFNCKSCKKTFSTKNQYENHLVSKKHKERALSHEANSANGENERTSSISSSSCGSSSNKKSKKSEEIAKESDKVATDSMEVDSDVESVDSDEWLDDTENPASRNDCLFCNHHSRSVVKNLKHMSSAHSFFIADPEYCIDIKGLLKYLGEKIYAGYMCIWCNETGKGFQSADAVKAHMIDKGHCKMLHEGDALAEFTDFYNYSTSYPDANEEDPDAEFIIPELDDGDFQLVLPSGNVIGHRSLMRYYKQSLNPNSVVPATKSQKLHRVLSQYRALGWTGTQSKAAVRKARDIKYMQRVQSKYSTQLQFKANKLQHHFRQQLLQ